MEAARVAGTWSARSAPWAATISRIAIAGAALRLRRPGLPGRRPPGSRGRRRRSGRRSLASRRRSRRRSARAAELLRASSLPLFGGLGTDVAGMREVLALAERTGGIVDHAGSRGLLANVRAMQDGGTVTATLAEVRNRADLVLLVGTDTKAIAPRLVERCLAPSDHAVRPDRAASWSISGRRRAAARRRGAELPG